MNARTDLSKLKAERRFLIRLLHFEQNEIVILGAETRLAKVMDDINQHQYGLQLFLSEPIRTEFKTPRDQAEWHEVRSDLAEYGRQIMLDKSYSRVQFTNEKLRVADQAEKLRNQNALPTVHRGRRCSDDNVNDGRENG